MSMEIEQINNLGIRLSKEYDRASNSSLDDYDSSAINSFNEDLKTFIELTYLLVVPIREKMKSFTMNAGLAGLDEFLGYIKRFNDFNSNELNYNNKIVKYFMNTFDTNLETLISVLNNMGAEQINRMDVFNKGPHFSSRVVK